MANQWTNAWTVEENEMLKNSYSELSTVDLTLLLPGRTKKAIQLQACRLNLTVKFERTFNEHAFSTLNNINSYYAGFIAADGCITDKNSLRIRLQETDSNYLEQFNSFMECSREVKYGKNNSRFNPHYFCEVSYGSQKLAEDLKNNFLLKPRKTLNVPFPKHLKLENKFSYIIGNFDGDGCVHVNKRNGFIISWLGDFKFLNYIRNLFFRLGWITDNTKYLNKKTESGVYQLRFTGTIAKRIYRELKWHIEEHNLPVLKRKWFNKGVKHISLKDFEEMKAYKLKVI